MRPIQELAPSFPLISIIMPTYNRAGLIGETIQSIRDQTYANWELIIVDDGSEDETEAVIRSFHENRIRYFQAGRMGIGGKIKNLGLQQAEGSFIAFNDSDDLWAKEKLSKQVHALLSFPEAGFCLTNGYNFREKGKPLDYFMKQMEGFICQDILIPLFRAEATVFTQVLMMRRECLGKAGNFREVKSFSDADFIINLARHYKAVLLYEPLVYRRLHDDNYIHANWEKSYFEGLAIIKENADLNLVPPSVIQDALFRLHINFGEKYLQLRETRKAVLQFLNAWKKKPFHTAAPRKIAKAFLRAFKTRVS